MSSSGATKLLDYQSGSIIDTPTAFQSSGQQSNQIRKSDRYYEDILGAQSAAGELGLSDAAVRKTVFSRTLGSGEFYKAALNPFAWGDYLSKQAGEERVRLTKELLKEESDRIAADEMAKRRRKNIAAGIMLMQQKGMINFFR